MFSIHEDITRLVFMGLAQFGQQMLAKDQVCAVTTGAAVGDPSVRSLDGGKRYTPSDCGIGHVGFV